MIAVRALDDIGRPATLAEIHETIAGYRGVWPYSQKGLGTELNDYSDSNSNRTEALQGSPREHYFAAEKRAGEGGANLWTLTGLRPPRPGRDTPPCTEVERSQTVRTRQQEFRQKALAFWGGRCCVSGIDHPGLLIAAHIKPWADATDAERTDVFNSLLLSPTYDKLFDKALITFTFRADGSAVMACSPWVEANVDRLGIVLDARITGLHRRAAPHLAFHNELFTRVNGL